MRTEPSDFSMRACRRAATAAVVAMTMVGLGACESATENENPNENVATITVSVSALTLAVGDTVRITATPKDASGAAVSGATVTWTTDAAGIASITNGLVLGVSAGSTIVHATSGTVTQDIAVTVTPAVSVTEFPIANTASDEDFGTVAYDGTNFLVAVQGTVGTSASTVEAQRVSATGTLLGSRIVISGASGDPGRVAFDGTNYLLVWADYSAVGGPTPVVTVRGQFISTAGALVGSTFQIATANTTHGGVIGLRYGGGTYFVAFAMQTSSTGDANLTTYGRLVSPSGVLGTQHTLNTTTTEGFNGVAFDGSRFLTVYTDGQSVMGRFVSTADALSAGITIHTFPVTEGVEPNVSASFNGTNYLVTHGRHGAGHGSGADTYAQLVSPAGTNVGSMITLAADPAIDELAVGSVAAGSAFLVSYLDNMASASLMRVRGRFVSGSGALLGSTMTLAGTQNGKSAIGGVFLNTGTKYFLLLQRGVPSTADPSNISAWTQTDIHGALLTIPTPGS